MGPGRARARAGEGVHNGHDWQGRPNHAQQRTTQRGPGAVRDGFAAHAAQRSWPCSLAMNECVGRRSVKARNRRLQEEGKEISLGSAPTLPLPGAGGGGLPGGLPGAEGANSAGLSETLLKKREAFRERMARRKAKMGPRRVGLDQAGSAPDPKSRTKPGRMPWKQEAPWRRPGTAGEGGSPTPQWTQNQSFSTLGQARLGGQGIASQVAAQAGVAISLGCDGMA